MMPSEDNPKPNYWWAMYHLKCPRCRRGDLFINANPYRKLSTNYMLGMHDKCPVCGQVYELEPAFWAGTSYVSYEIALVFSAITFIVWWLVIGFSLDDNRLIYWLIVNAVLNLALQPVFMRLSRWIFLNIFVHYNENWKSEDGVKLT